MSFSSESIEAKLCAYIEGDLDADGRAEIERHLAGNPQHKKLIEELIQTRQLIRTLPRISAPPEVREQLTNQMERSLLLGDDQGSPSSQPMRLRRFPQMAALAAVLALTLGLGAVVWFVLGPTFRRPTVTIAPTPQASQPKTEAAPEEVEARRGAGQAGDEDGATRTTDVIASKAGPELREAVHGKGSGGFAMKTAGNPADLSDSGNSSAQAIAFDPSAVDARLTSNGYAISTPASPNGAPVYVVVSSSDPSAASAEVQQFLSANKIQWEPVPAEKSQSNGVSLGAGAVAVNPSSTDNATGTNAKSSDAEASSNNDRHVAIGGGNVTQQPAAPSDHDMHIVASRDAGNMGMASGDALQTQQNQALQTATAISISNVYVARRMTKDQAAQLQASLAQPRAGQQCAVFQRPTELRLQISLPPSESVAPANAPAGISDAAPTTRPAEAVWAKPAAEVGNRLTEPTTKPSDERALIPPTTAPSANEAMGGGGAGGVPATQPTADVQAMPAQATPQQVTGQLLAAAPATQPAPTEPVDVVIVVQNQTTPANAPPAQENPTVAAPNEAPPTPAAPPEAPAPATQPTPENPQMPAGP